MMNDEFRKFIQHSQFTVHHRLDRGMVSMVSMEVSKTLGPGSSPGTPARVKFEEK